MGAVEKKINTRKNIGDSNYLNKNCWLIKNLNYAPYKRCQYCELKFNHCLFLHYQIVSLAVVFLFFIFFILIEKRLSPLSIITVFALIIVYGYFFNISTEKIVKANFFLKKTKNELNELMDNLEDKVDEQTKNLQEKNTHLQKLLKMRSEFLDIASHQLRTPTSVIKGTASMMIDKDFERLSHEVQSQHINNIWQKSVKLEEIINDILSASEMDTEKYELVAVNMEKIDIVDMIKKIIDEIHFDAEQKGIILELKPAVGKVLTVEGERKYLKQAIVNLINNAVKYTPEKNDLTKEKGRVIIEVSAIVGKVLIKISDNGIGIPKAELTKLFKKFSRGSNAKEAYTDGSGLGLFIVKEIIDGHGGQITVTSDEGRGSVFTISLPVSAPQVLAVSKPRTAQPSALRR